MGRTVENRVNDTERNSEISSGARDPYRLRRTSLFRDQDHTVPSLRLRFQKQSVLGRVWRNDWKTHNETRVFIQIPNAVRDPYGLDRATGKIREGISRLPRHLRKCEHRVVLVAEQ